MVFVLNKCVRGADVSCESVSTKCNKFRNVDIISPGVANPQSAILQQNKNGGSRVSYARLDII